MARECSLSAAAAAAKSLQLCPTLRDPIDGSPPGSPIPGILQARTLEWVAISFSNAWKWKVKVKSCPILSYPMDCSLPGSSVHGIFQARVLEWGAIAFSGSLSAQPQMCAFLSLPPGIHHWHHLLPELVWRTPSFQWQLWELCSEWQLGEPAVGPRHLF